MTSPEPQVNLTTALDRAVLGWLQELSPHGVLVTDVELRVKRWNLWMETSSGIPRTQAMERRLFEIFPELLKRRMDRYFEAALKGEVSLLSSALHGYLLPFPTPISEAGLLHMLQTARIAPLIEDGEVVGTITTIEDVTQREYQNSRVSRQHQRQELFSWALARLIETPEPEQMIKTIFPRISAHIYVDTYLNYFLEPDGQHLRLHTAAGIPRELQQRMRVINLAQALCGGNGRHDEPLVISSIDECSDPKAMFARELGLRAYVCNPLRVGDKLIGTLAFGSRTRSRFSADEVDFTRIVAQYVAIAIDRARSEAALRAAQDELSGHAQSLERRVQERTHKLHETIGELESFSYSLAHDVRAPLRHIHGFADVLLQDHGHELSPDARRHLDSISGAVRRLETLTHDILEYSRVSRKPVELRPINIQDLLQEIIAHDAVLSAPDVVTIRQPLQRVLAERTLLDQCVTNLLDNARKFIPPNVPPRISIYTELRNAPHNSHEQTAVQGPLHPVHPPFPPQTEYLLSGIDSDRLSWVRIWIEDNGIGIPPEFHGKIFGIFERLSNQHEGTGIGLAIVSKAVQRMGGRFGVESESGKGSRFWIELIAAD